MVESSPSESVVITGPETGCASSCEPILRALPAWFGIDSAIAQYVKDIEQEPTFLARVDNGDGEVVGFVTIRRHFPESAEVHVMGIRAEYHRRGIGRTLIEAAERWLAADRCRLLQVKTVSADCEDPYYGRTRAFYRAVGFQPLEVFPTLWDARNPCLVLVKALDRTGDS